MSEEKRDEFNLSVETLPGQVVSNIATIKDWINENVEPYLKQVVTPDQAKFAKKDLAMLRKVKTQLEDERKRAKTIIMKPYADFEALYKDAISSLDSAIAGIDGQLKAIEATQKAQRRDEITAAILKGASDIGGEELLMRLERDDVMGWFFDEKWLNASTAMSSVMTAVNEKLNTVWRDIQCINKSAGSGEAFITYYRTGSLSAALEADRIARQEAERIKAMKAAEEQNAVAASTIPSAPPAPEPVKTWDEVVRAHEESLHHDDHEPRQIVIAVPDEPEDERMRAPVQIPVILEFPLYKKGMIREIMTKAGIRMLRMNEPKKESKGA